MTAGFDRARTAALPKKMVRAVERAQTFDRLWFGHHPGHSYYCRWALPMEWDHDPVTGERARFGSIPRHWSSADREDPRLVVLVTRIDDGVRVRQPLFVLPPVVAEHDIAEALWPALRDAARTDPGDDGLAVFWRWLAYWGDRLGAAAEPWLGQAEALGMRVHRNR